MNEQTHFGTVIRLGFSFLGAVVLFCATAGVHGLLALGNYLIAEQAFVLQNFEEVTLNSLPLLGTFASALGIGNATIAQVFAAGLVGAVNAVVVILISLIIRAVRLGLERREYSRTAGGAATESDRNRLTEQVALADDALVRCCVWMAILIPAGFLLARWDVSQFGLRWEANVTQIADVSEMTTTGLDRTASLGAYLAQFLSRSSWGYLAALVGMCVASHYALERVGERWEATTRTAAKWWGEQFQDDALAPANAATNVPDQAAPIPFEAGPAATPTDYVAPSVTSPEPGKVTPIDTPLAPPTTGDGVPPVPPPSSGETVDVVAGHGEVIRLPIAEIRSQPDRYVHDGTRWWTRAYFEAIDNLDAA